MVSLISFSKKVGATSYLPQDIIRLQASSNYTHIFFTNKKKILVPKVLKEFELILEPYGFLRTHRAHLVNQAFIQTINSKGQIVMADQSKALLSRRKKDVCK